MQKINEMIVEVVNSIIASPKVQGAQFTTSSNCSKVSVINDIEFCDELKYSYSYAENSINSACVSACAGIKSASYSTCDGVRKTCKSACFGIKSCENGCDKISSDCKKTADSLYNACVSACSITKITGGVEFKLEWVKGAGSIKLTSVTNIVPHADDDKVFSVDLELVVEETQVNAYYKIWQDPLPEITGHELVSANKIPGKATGTLVKICGAGSGYFLTIDALSIEVPQDVVDTSGIIALAESIALPVSIVTDGFFNLNKMLFDYVNGFLSCEIKSVLNDILDSTKIMDADC